MCMCVYMHVRGSGGNMGGIRGEGERRTEQSGSEGSRAKNKVLE